MKKNNLWRIIWIVGIYAVLVLALVLVTMYKTKWESKDLNTYLYFYDCHYNLCSSKEKPNNYYNRIRCNSKNDCPSIKDKIGNNIILMNNTNTWIYDYIDNRIISNEYLDYRYIGNDNYVFVNENNLEGVIDIYGNIIVPAKYNFIDEYCYKNLVYKNNNLYGIETANKTDSIYAIYKDISLVNDQMFAAKMPDDNKYTFINYTGRVVDDSLKYDYVYAYNGIILTVKDKKIDILDLNIKSLLVMKINSYFEYLNSSEINSLNILAYNNNLFFRVYLNENKYTDYKFDTVNKKIISL